MSLNVYAVVTPFVLLLILAEIAWCVWKKNGYYEFQDSIASPVASSDPYYTMNQALIVRSGSPLVDDAAFSG